MDVVTLGAAKADARRRYPTAQPGALVNTLRREQANASVVLLGDSTGNETTEWFYRLLTALGAKFPRWTITYHLWNDGNQTYDAPTTIQTGNGSRTLTVYNGSVVGANADYINGTYGRITTMIPAQPTTVFWSYGYNGGAVTDYRTILGPSVRLVTSYYPGAETVIVAQPPKATGSADYANHLLRVASVRDMALSLGAVLIDAQRAFYDYTGNIDADLIQGDLTHPTVAGSTVWGDEAVKVIAGTPLRLTQPMPSVSSRTLWLPANAFDVVTGSPTLTFNTTAGAHGWALDPAVVEEVGATVNVPAEWGPTRVRLAFITPSGASGGVRWTPRYGSLSSWAQNRGAAGNSLSATGGQTTSTVTANTVQIDSVYAGDPGDSYGGRIRQGRPLTVKVTREATDGADTCTTDVIFLGLLFERVYG